MHYRRLLCSQPEGQSHTLAASRAASGLNIQPGRSHESSTKWPAAHSLLIIGIKDTGH